MSASSSKKVIFAALGGNTLIALTKFAAASVTGSSAMLSEGIHSLVDTGNQVLLLYGLRRAARPADERFPFGYGKEIYFWSFVVAILIFALGAGVSIYEGYHHLVHPAPLSDPTVNYIVLSLAVLFEGLALFYALREFRRSKGTYGYLEGVMRGKNPSLFVVLFEDTAAMLGLLAAFGGVFLTHLTGMAVFDGLASIIIGLILGATAVWLAYETKGLLIGESADPECVSDIRAILDSFPSIEAVHEILTLHMGPEFILVTVSVDFRDDIECGEVEKRIAAMDSMIKERHPHVKRVYVEPESRKGLV